jgi:hypothetical protein
MSPYHQTVFLQNNSGNFNWSEYKIEGQSLPIPALTNYKFERDNLSNGNYTPIATLGASSTSYTDAQYSTYLSTATWRARTVWNISCTPTRTTVNTSTSNIKHLAHTGIVQTELASAIAVYPNPANGNVMIELSEQIRKATITIQNAMGQLLYEENVSSAANNKTIKTIDISTYGKGIYTVTIENAGNKTYKKLVVD